MQPIIALIIPRVVRHGHKWVLTGIASARQTLINRGAACLDLVCIGMSTSAGALAQHSHVCLHLVYLFDPGFGEELHLKFDQCRENL